MPKKSIDYSKTIIYKLVCKDLDVKDLYVGHTTNWKQRKKCHKNCCINNTEYKQNNLKVYKTMRENGGWDNWEMIEIEKYPCNDEREASARERYWYEQLHAELNMIRPLRTIDERKQKQKEYNQRPEVKEHKKEYRARPDVKERKIITQQIWRENNQEKCKEYEKKRPCRKEYKKEKGKEKITCSCGSEVRKWDIKRHERTTKHQQYIESLN